MEEDGRKAMNIAVPISFQEPKPMLMCKSNQHSSFLDTPADSARVQIFSVCECLCVWFFSISAL